MAKSSHEGASGMGASHINRMMKEHGCPDHKRAHGAAGAGNRPENENRENRKMERGAERDEREDG